MTYRPLAVALLVPVLLVPVLLAADKPDPDPARFEKEIAAYEAADKKNPPPEGAVLFFGSSGIRLWRTLAADFPEHKVINRGFGGGHASECVLFADRVVIPYKPRTIVLQVGGNDVNDGKTPERVLADHKAFVTMVRAKLPATKFVFFSLLPSPARWKNADALKRTNALLKAYAAAEKDIAYVDGWDAFLGPDGKPREELFVADRLHHNAEGYKIRTALVKPHL